MDEDSTSMSTICRAIMPFTTFPVGSPRSVQHSRAAFLDPHQVHHPLQLMSHQDPLFWWKGTGHFLSCISMMCKPGWSCLCPPPLIAGAVISKDNWNKLMAGLCQMLPWHNLIFVWGGVCHYPFLHTRKLRARQSHNQGYIARKEMEGL